MTLRRLMLLAVSLAGLGVPRASAAEWTERYFGVGSGNESGAACVQARGHAETNSSGACGGRGIRGDASFTDCICSRASEGVHVCNVKLEVLCDGPLASAGGSGDARQPRGEPKGRAGRRSATREASLRARAGRSGSEAGLLATAAPERAR